MKLDEALKLILRNVNVLEIEEKPLAECIGQVTAKDICSDFSLPMAATSGPDGYAVRSSDIAGASREKPVTLRIVGTVRAGVVPKLSVKPGTAIRIMTGSIVPKGANCVVRFEDTDEPGNKSGPNRNSPTEVKIYVMENTGANMRPAGSNVSRGSLILPKGKTIGPAQICALTSIGKVKVKVIRRPKIAVIATGDELINPGNNLSVGKSYNSNTPAVSALITHYGGVPQALGIARDT
ncbi:MAG TPA: molybdopterin molybdotransferase MoeA, partial [Dehalococcoidales bacterium]|nr:molybdopterin molybdotransferase MoeA [Dehalococcoidales bacterium]